jgi:hyaluronan synthase
VSTLRTYAAKIYKYRVSIAFIAIPLVVFGICYMKFLNVAYFWYQPLINIYSLIVTFYIFSRFIFAFFYRPPEDTNYHPEVTIIVPVKNDEEIIKKTIDHCYGGTYPKEKVEVIVINDGSTDGTLDRIYESKEKYPQLQVVNFPENKGKRDAMAVGARMAKGEILVYIDSDSLIAKESLHYMVQGFSDPKVGAICGHANILNANENLLTKMQEVRYFTAFKVIKAAEHVFSAVSCCSGCLSAYRKSYVMEVLDIWLNQRFFGSVATFGDDRSLTNFILKKYRVLYDSRAVVETMAPARWYQFFKQQARWKKSWFRESLIAGKFMWLKHPFASISFYLGILFPLISPVVVFSTLLYRPIMHHQIPFSYSVGLALISLLYSLYYATKRPNSKWLYGIVFCFLYVSVLSWQTYYAIATSRKNHWGTR